MNTPAEFVAWFRSVAPYINAFRGKTFVIGFSGEMVTNAAFVDFIHDVNLLASLGVRLVLVHGARPQIQLRLDESQLETQTVMGMRVTDPAALQCVKESVGRVHHEIAALLSMGLPNSPMANAAIRVTSGNFVTACPYGVIQGIDLMHTGKVRKINAPAIHSRLEQGDVVLISPLGYSPTGEIFNLTMENVATETAIALHAEKLILLLDSADTSVLPRELTLPESKLLLENKTPATAAPIPDAIRSSLQYATKACELGVTRAHLVSRHIDGAIVQELFTHDGIGCMISQETLQALRKARIDDVGGILQLIEPLEAEGILVRRGRELLEIEIDRFTVFEHDGIILGCAALYPFPEEHACELACLAIHPDYRDQGHGERLLKHIENKTIAQGIHKLFVLTTHATHWFIEHGFSQATPAELPKTKQNLYNYQRRSKVLIKHL
ncbi:amino-acid N-acetyltransferase [Nitrosomonas sp. Is24]|uniref:amino-acid N-acetyltransferase n=1 Tax=Nitrosomonas sp. Is24 TaxID=3080533 RepID=UPI00294B59F2|nr:amino-acid N-acetyltransferase [Nitrosomonas sp. Is24]MDV6340462.1 amino-acid N-acetyltransferase [Nitrosomonas sp. Is24]